MEYKGIDSQIEQHKLQFMVHIMRHKCIEINVLTGMAFGKLSRGCRVCQNENNFENFPYIINSMPQ